MDMYISPCKLLVLPSAPFPSGAVSAHYKPNGDSTGVVYIYHFRGCMWYVQPSMEFRPEDVSLLERCPLLENLFNFLPRINGCLMQPASTLPRPYWLELAEACSLLHPLCTSSPTTNLNSGNGYSIFRNSDAIYSRGREPGGAEGA